MKIKNRYPIITLILACFFMLGQLPLHASNDLSLSVSLSSSFATCDVSNDASVTASTDGGNSPYSYEWSVPNNGSDPWKLEGVGVGFYSVTVTDDDGQTATATEEVELSPEGIWVMLNVETEVSCAGGNNGVVHAGPMTGLEPYSYEWSDGQTTQDAYGLSAGNICVTVTDANGCTGAECIDVENGDSDLSVSLSSSFATCDVSNDASVTASTDGGNAPYTYEWSAPNSGSDPWKLEGVGAGTYSVTVTDSDGCSVVATEEVELSPEGIWIMLNVETEVSCAGGNNGVVHAGPMTGLEPYSYEWSDGQTTQDAYGLSAGNICVTVTDANGCSGVECIDVENGDSDLSVSLSSSFATCDVSNDASVTASTDGGNPPFTYEWSVPNSGSDPWKLEGVGAGTYSVTVTDSDGCSVVATEEVELSPEGIWVMLNVEQEIACFGGSDGVVHAGAMTGAAPYTYEWSNGETGEDAFNVSAGNICVTVTDSNGCSGVECIDVDEPDGMDVTVSSDGTACGSSNGSASVDVSGGASPYEYEWSTGGTSDEIDNVSGGTYTVTITDANNCTVVQSVDVDESSSVSLVMNSDMATCVGNDGSATVTASGGVSPYTYSWSSGGSSSTETNLSGGNYTVTVTDAAGCTAVSSVNVAQQLDCCEDPTIVSVVIFETPCGVEEGSINVTMVENPNDYNFIWSTPNGSGLSATNLAAGTYSLAIIDASDATCNQNLTFTVDSDNGPEVTINTTPATCTASDGTATITSVDPTATYEYQWSTSDTGSSLTNLAEGEYQVTIIDPANPDCPGFQTVVIAEENSFVATVSIVEPNCGEANGSATITTNGTGPFTYSWASGTNTLDNISSGNYTVLVTDLATGCSDNLTFSVNDDVTPVEIIIDPTETLVSCPGQNDGTVTFTVNPPSTTVIVDAVTGAEQTNGSLSPGSYCIQAVNSDDCLAGSACFEVLEPAQLDVDINTSDVSCLGMGSIGLVNLTGGVAPYTVDWSPSGIDLSALDAGNYSFTLTDANGCSISEVVTINTDVSELTINLNTTEADCSGTNGSISITNIEGGTAPYDTLWSTGGTASELTDLSPGNYSVTITDANGCTGVSTVNVAQQLDCCEGPTIVSVVIFETPCGVEEGSINVTIVENPNDYNFIWSTPNGTGLSAANLAAGTYSLAIIDASDPNCNQTLTVTVDSEDGPEVTINTTPATCTASDGTATITPVDPTATYEYQWSTSDTGSSLTNLAEGEYQVTIIDPANPDCPGFQTVVVEEENSFVASVSIVEPNCGEANGSATITTNGTGPFTYSWASGTNTLDNIASGIYTVLVTDLATGCSDNLTFSVNDDVTPVEIVIDPTETLVSCPGQNDGTVTFTVNPPSTTVIVDAVTGAEQTNGNLSPGSYCVQAVNADDCLAGSACFEVLEPTQLDVDINTSDVSCLGMGSIGLVNITGGVTPYTVDWSPSGIDLSALDAGDYSFTLTDANGCSISETITINSDAAALTVTLNTTDANCSGDNGAISIMEIVGGTAPYDTLWSTGSSAANLSDLLPGNYSVSITDANGCVGTASAMINDKQPPVITSVVVVETPCLLNEGVATISLSEDEANYTWTWSGGVSTSNQATGLAVGTYDVTIADPSDPSCVIYETFTVGSVDGPEAQLVTTPANCAAADGVAFFNPPTYTYEWSDGPVGSGRNNLLAGEYQVTIYDADNPDCIDVVTVVIDEANALELSYTVQEPDCGVANGTATISVDAGGSGGPYEYAWSNSTAAEASTQDGLVSGAYSVTVTDPATGCSKDLYFVLNDALGGGSVVITSTDVMVSCPGAQDGEVIFDVSPAGSTVVIEGMNGMVYTNGELGPGTYCIIVTDAAGCVSASDCFDVVEPDQIDVDIAVYDVVCDETGGITLLNIIGGTGDYDVVWDAPVVSTDTILTNLDANDYTFTLTDANGCAVGADLTVDDNSVELDVTVALDGLLACTGDSTGTVTAVATGGTPEYVYDWGTMGTGDTLMEIPAGTYVVTATDVNGCMGIDSIVISEPDPVFVQLQDDTIACEDVIELVVLTGSTTSITWFNKAGDIVGTGNPLEVMVEDTACYYVEVMDLNGCPGKDSILVIDGGDLVPDFTWNYDQCGDSAIISFVDLSTASVGDIVEWEWVIAGTVYNEENPVVIFTQSGNVDVVLTVTSATGCTETMENSFPLLVAPQPPILDSLNICPGGASQLYPNFDPSFEYSWSPATYLDDPNIGNPTTSAENDIVYSVTVTFPDSSCQVVRQVQVQIFDEAQTEIMAADTVLCESGSVSLSATGTGSNFIWSDTDGNVLGNGSPVDLEVRDPSDPYIYLEMTDDNGCVAMDSILVADYSIGLEPPADALICPGDSAFLEPIAALNGAVDYNFEWTPDELIVTDPTVIDVMVSPTETTTYTVTVSNEHCSSSVNALVEVADVSISAVAEPDTICLSQSTQLDVLGDGSYTYEWLEPSSATLDFDNVPNPIATPVETTEYVVRVTDENNCEATAAVRVVVIDPECREPFIFFPNAFSPNNDGHNDVLYLRGFNADEVFFVIYNRWGEKVYESNRQEDGWDGTYKGERLDSDVFGYYLRVRCTNGENYMKKGNVTLLR